MPQGERCKPRQRGTRSDGLCEKIEYSNKPQPICLRGEVVQNRLTTAGGCYFAGIRGLAYTCHTFSGMAVDKGLG